MVRTIPPLCLALALVLAVPAASRDGITPAIPDPESVPIALMVDLSSGQTLYAREADRRFIPASITKVMTMFVAFELMDEGRLSPGQTFTMSERAYEDWHRVGSTMFLDRDSQPTVDDLLLGITTVSANDGCVVLAEGATGSIENWVALMNAKAREIGMKDSRFGSANGWPDGGKTFVTARDLAILAQALFARHGDKYARYFGHRELRTNGIAQSSHDPITGVVPGADGIKTGFTNQAGNGFLGTAQRDGRRLVMVVAAVDGEGKRREASRSFIEWGFSAFDSQPLYAAGATVGAAAVQNGMERSVALRTAQAVAFSRPTGGSAKVTLSIRYDGPLQAPIKAGEQVAELEIAVDGIAPARVPLIAAEDIDEAGPWQRLLNGLAGLVS